jgi:Helix-turn-helix.
MTEQEALADKLRECREYLGYTQEQVAAHLGVSRLSLCQAETGRRRVPAVELAKLAKLYQKPAGYFLGEEVEPAEWVAALSGTLDETDRQEITKFAQFLAWRKMAKEG